MITLQERVHSSPPPSNWNLNKLHRVFRVRKGQKNLGMREDNLLSLSYGRIINKDIDTADGLLPESFETYQIVEPGNIVMRLTDLQNDKRSLRQGLVKERGIITSAYDALELERSHDPRFWAYALLALDLAKYYYSLGAGVRQSIKFADFPNDWIATPDENTQKAIADFLDRETDRIDQLIGKKQKLVALLEERFNAIRSQIFRNLDAALVRPLRWMIRDICDGPFGSGLTSAHYSESGVRVVRLQNIKEGGFDDKDAAFISEAHYATLGDHDVHPGDLLIAGLGDDKNKVGRACVAPNNLGATMVKADCYRARLDQRVILHEYAAAFLCSDKCWPQIDALAKGVTRSRLNLELVRRILIPVPSLEEQLSVVQAIEVERSAFVETREKTQTSIERLKEYRSALITAAVTGQIDVESWGKSGQTDRRLDQIEEEMSLREARA